MKLKLKIKSQKNNPTTRGYFYCNLTKTLLYLYCLLLSRVVLKGGGYAAFYQRNSYKCDSRFNPISHL